MSRASSSIGSSRSANRAVPAWSPRPCISTRQRPCGRISPQTPSGASTSSAASVKPCSTCTSTKAPIRRDHLVVAPDRVDVQARLGRGLGVGDAVGVDRGRGRRRVRADRSAGGSRCRGRRTGAPSSSTKRTTPSARRGSKPRSLSRSIGGERGDDAERPVVGAAAGHRVEVAAGDDAAVASSEPSPAASAVGPARRLAVLLAVGLLPSPRPRRRACIAVGRIGGRQRGSAVLGGVAVVARRRRDVGVGVAPPRPLVAAAVGAAPRARAPRRPRRTTRPAAVLRRSRRAGGHRRPWPPIAGDPSSSVSTSLTCSRPLARPRGASGLAAQRSPRRGGKATGCAPRRACVRAPDGTTERGVHGPHAQREVRQWAGDRKVLASRLVASAVPERSQAPATPDRRRASSAQGLAGAPPRAPLRGGTSNTAAARWPTQGRRRTAPTEGEAPRGTGHREVVQRREGLRLHHRRTAAAPTSSSTSPRSRRPATARSTRTSAWSSTSAGPEGPAGRERPRHLTTHKGPPQGRAANVRAICPGSGPPQAQRPAREGPKGPRVRAAAAGRASRPARGRYARHPAPAVAPRSQGEPRRHVEPIADAADQSPT